MDNIPIIAASPNLQKIDKISIGTENARKEWTRSMKKEKQTTAECGERIKRGECDQERGVQLSSTWFLKRVVRPREGSAIV